MTSEAPKDEVTSPTALEETISSMPASTDPEEKKAIDALLKEIKDLKLPSSSTPTKEQQEELDDSNDGKTTTTKTDSKKEKVTDVEMGSEMEKLLGEAVEATVLRQFPKADKDPDFKWLTISTLRYRHYDIKSATDRLVRYLDWRSKNDVIGANIAKDTKLQTQIKDKLIRLLPTHDKHERGILVLNIKNHKPKLYTAAETVKMVHWTLVTALKNDPKIQKNGFVVINDLSGGTHHNLDLNIPKQLLPLFAKIFPARVGGIYILNPNPIIQVVLPLYKQFSPKLATRLHIYGTNKEKLLRNFEKDSIHEEVGGTVKLEVFDKWLAEQITVAEKEK